MTERKHHRAADTGIREGAAMLHRHSTETSKRAAAANRLSNGLADLQKTAVVTTSKPIRRALPLTRPRASGDRTYEFGAQDSSSLLLQLVHEGLLADPIHTRLMEVWKAQGRDYAHLAPGVPGMDTISVDQLVEMSDSELLTMGLDARQVLELRMAADADATAVAAAHPALTKTDVDRYRAQLAAGRQESTERVQSLDDYCSPTERSIYRTLPPSSSDAAMTEVEVQDLLSLGRGITQRALKRLVDMGWAVSVPNWGPPPGRANGYLRAPFTECEA